MKSNLFSTKRLLFGVIISWAVLSAVVVFFFSAVFISNDRDRETVIIPSYVGHKLESIESSANIRIENEPVFSDTVPQGVVISQVPSEGAEKKVKRGGYYTVKLIVSLGKERLEIPDLKDYNYTDAAVVLRSIGARVRIVPIYSKNGVVDSVLKTSPQKGEMISVGDTVTLFVRRKHAVSSVKVGDYQGMLLPDACRMILSSGLFIGDIDYVEIDGTSADVVVSQSIPQGSWVRYGSYISLSVAKGTEENSENKHPYREDIKIQ